MADDDQVKRRRGRPPLTPEDRPARVHVSLSAEEFDRVYARAKRLEVSIPEVFRRGVRRALAEDREDD